MDLDLISAGGVAESLTAILVLIGTLGAGYRWLWPVMKRWGARWILFWTGFDTVPLIHGNLAALTSSLERIEAHGLAEAVKGTERGEAIVLMGRKVDSIANTQRAVMNTNPRMATFEADDAGLWTAVNKVYGKWTGLSIQDAGRWGWLNGIHPSDRDRVRQAWTSCVADARRFECRFRLLHTNGKELEVDAAADPIPDQPAPCERWLGTMYEVQTGSLQ